MKNIPIDNLKMLVDEIIQQREIKEKEKRRNFRVEFAKVALTPLIVAIVGTLGTLIIADNNNRNAERIAKEQIKAATIRADMIEKGADSRSRAERDVERLKQIKEIFQDIVNEEEKTSPDYSSIQLHVSSLEIYGDLALNFLVKIRDIYKDKDPDVAKIAKNSILNILRASQPDFSGYKIIGESEILNLRTRQLNGLNFNGSIFSNVNLFKAGFKRSTLKGVKFHKVDLARADFGWADLDGASFEAGTDLRKTNFVGANLQNVKFQNCRNLGDALFSLNALLNADKQPFMEIQEEDYLNLLTPHIDELKAKYDKDVGSLNKLLKKFEINYDGLMRKLERNRNRRTASAPDKSERVEAEFQTSLG